MNRNLMIAAATAAAISLGGPAALPHEGATGVVKKRMDVMETLGDTMKALTGMMRGKQSYDADRVRAAASKIADHGGEALTQLFPENSLDDPTKATPAIWTDWERFSALANQLADYGTALKAAAGNPRPAGGGTAMGDGPMTMGTSMMMGRRQTAMDGRQMMMGGSRTMSPKELAAMPPDAAFAHLANTCSSCHQYFRKEKQ